MLNVCQTASACLLTAREMTQRSGSLRELERFLGSDQSQRCCFLGSLLTTCRILNNPLLHIMIFICHISSACHACLCLNHVFYFGETEYAQPFLFLLKRRWFVLQRIWLEAGNIRTFVSWWFSTFWLDLTQMRSCIYMLVMWDKNLKSENNTFFFFDPWIYVTISLQSKIDNLLFYLLPLPALCYVPDPHRLLCMWKKDGFFYFIILFGFAVEFLILWTTPFGCGILLFQNLVVAHL